MENLFLARGQTGSDIFNLQRELVRLGLMHESEIDGDFGGMTEGAVRQFQVLSNLSVDGVVGEQTWAKLLERQGVAIAQNPPSSISTKWNLVNIEQSASIIPNGSFTWAEATRGGSRMPPDQETLEGMIRIATMAQKARDLIARPFVITSWYRDPESNASAGGVSNSRHLSGDAIDFYVDGLTGAEIYAMLDEMWEGGLGQYTRFPFLCHIDARDYRARWSDDSRH